jgi:membrane-bound lytic murein transglycosylase D
LRQLYHQFESWPLALAAYNAGGGRVNRTLNTQRAMTFAEISDSLPAETRMYVPKVLATMEKRAGTNWAKLPPPRK